METEYKDLIDFHKLKECIISKRTTSKYVAEDTGMDKRRISQFINGFTIPMSDNVAKVCWALKVPVSELVDFKGIKLNPYFDTMPYVYDVPKDAVGEVTYKPLWNFLKIYLKDHEGKTANDLFDKIEPYRRRIGLTNLTRAREASCKARGIDENFVARVKRQKDYYKTGLTEETRTKLHNDRPLSMRTIYDICKFLGCSVDFVMSYK